MFSVKFASPVWTVLMILFCGINSALIPSGPNKLIDILLSKDINGLSPTKRRQPLGQRKSRGRASISAKVAVTAAKKNQTKATPKKATTKAVTPKNKTGKAGKTKTTARVQDEEEDEVVEVKKPKSSAKRKNTADVEEDDDVVEVKRPRAKRKSAAAPSKAVGRAKAKSKLPSPDSGTPIILLYHGPNSSCSSR